METLATPAITAVVRPSVDTLMARCFTDLSQDDLVYYVPEVDEGRYWVHSFYDAWVYILWPKIKNLTCYVPATETTLPISPAYPAIRRDTISYRLETVISACNWRKGMLVSEVQSTFQHHMARF